MMFLLLGKINIMVNVVVKGGILLIYIKFF